MQHGRVTILDIADDVGVTAAMVSLALRNSPRVEESTRQKILASAKKLGYESSLSALMSGRGSINAAHKSTDWGFVAPLAETTMFASVLASLVDITQDKGIKLWARDSNYCYNHARLQIRELLFQGLGAICIAPPETGIVDPETLYLLHQSGIPVVAMKNLVEGLNCPVVSIDYEAQGRLSAEHLISCGCRYPAFMAGRWWHVTRTRLRGFRGAILRAGLDLPEEHVGAGYGPDWEEKAAAGHWDDLAEEYRRAVERFIALAPHIDGVDCGHDTRAIQFIETCAGLGKRCPDDIKVIGCDNCSDRETSQTSISTFSLRGELMGQHIHDLLSRMLAGEKLTRADSVYLEPELIARNSTAAIH